MLGVSSRVFFTSGRRRGPLARAEPCGHQQALGRPRAHSHCSFPKSEPFENVRNCETSRAVFQNCTNGAPTVACARERSTQMGQAHLEKELTQTLAPSALPTEHPAASRDTAEVCVARDPGTDTPWSPWELSAPCPPVNGFVSAPQSPWVVRQSQPPCQSAGQR